MQRHWRSFQLAFVGIKWSGMATMNSCGRFLVIWGNLFRLLFLVTINQIETNMQIFICEWAAPPEILRYQMITFKIFIFQMEIWFFEIIMINLKRMHHVYMHSIKYYGYYLRRQRLRNANVAHVMNVARIINFILFLYENTKSKNQLKKTIFSHWKHNIIKCGTNKIFQMLYLHSNRNYSHKKRNIITRALLKMRQRLKFINTHLRKNNSTNQQENNITHQRQLCPNPATTRYINFPLFFLPH